jgi:antitoxin component YwqK of YwqJK toxin-antitoxin module
MKYTYVYIIVFISALVCCEKSDEKITIESSTEGLELVNGILELNKISFSGRLTTRFENNKLKSEIFYTKGKKHGSEKYWSKSGALIQERFYKNGYKTGTHSAWWSPKSPKFVYHFNNQGAFHGEVKEWYRSGQLYMSFNYENGNENGRQQLWKVDGTIKANYEVVNGERFGLIGLKKCNNVRDPEIREIVKNEQ